MSAEARNLVRQQMIVSQTVQSEVGVQWLQHFRVLCHLLRRLRGSRRTCLHIRQETYHFVLAREI
jgi:hypothetical protein